MPSNYPLLRSLNKEEQPAVEAVVTGGQIPDWVNGTLFRNGPGRYNYGDKEYRHLFDGHACVHKFRVQDGRVFYSNKFLQSTHYNKCKEEKRLYPVFGTADICTSIFGRFQTFYTGKGGAKVDNTNVSIMPYNYEHLYALTETNFVCKLDPKNLEILKTISVSKYIPEATTTIAHPHIEDDGGWICMGMNTKGKVPHYNFLRYKGGKEVTSGDLFEKSELIAKVPSSHSYGISYLHSFGLSQNYIIYVENSLVFDFTSFLIGIVTNRSFADNLVMHDKWNARIHLVNRHTGQVVKQEFETDPLFTFHHINAYEKYDENGKVKEILVDLCAYDASKFQINKFTYRDMFTESMLDSTAKRITIPFNGDELESNPRIHCKIETFNPSLLMEFPIINYEKNNAKPYKYVWGTNVAKKPFSIVKLNVDNPEEFLEFKYEDNGKNYFPSEPAFVPNPNGTSEDDGVLLVMVLAEDQDLLSVLDAKTLKEIARAKLPEEAKGATTFHGFFASKALFGKLNEI